MRGARAALGLVFGLMLGPVLALATEAAEPTRFSVTVSGEGPDVILIPGLASSGAVWDETVKRLAQHHRVHVVQVAGFAGAPAGPNAQGPLLAPMVEELSEYAAKLGHPAIIGHSLGGLAALEAAAKHPEAVGRVLVVDALPFYGLLSGPFASVAMMTPQAAITRQVIEGQSPQAFAASEKSAMAGMVKSPDGQAQALAWAIASDRHALANALYDDMTTDARSDLPKIKTPVTVLYAWDPDMHLPAANADRLYASAYKGLAGVVLKRIDGTHHFIMLDQPTVFAAEVEAFLR